MEHREHNEKESCCDPANGKPCAEYKGRAWECPQVKARIQAEAVKSGPGRFKTYLLPER